MKVISIIIPTLNESQTIQPCLRQLSDMRNRGHEVIVVDGGSIDDTLDKARPLADIIIDMVQTVRKLGPSPISANGTPITENLS